MVGKKTIKSSGTENASWYTKTRLRATLKTTTAGPSCICSSDSDTMCMDTFQDMHLPTSFVACLAALSASCLALLSAFEVLSFNGFAPAEGHNNT